MKEEISNTKAPICPYCGTKTYLTSFRYMKLRSFKRGANKGRNRLVYMCPKCHKHVNVHRGTNIAMGFPGDSEVKLWRKFTHYIFDQLWRKKNGNRKKCYTWLSKNLGIDQEECHIGMFTSEECKRAIELCIKELSRLPDGLK